MVKRRHGSRLGTGTRRRTRPSAARRLARERMALAVSASASGSRSAPRASTGMAQRCISRRPPGNCGGGFHLWLSRRAAPRRVGRVRHDARARTALAGEEVERAEGLKLRRVQNPMTVSPASPPRSPGSSASTTRPTASRRGSPRRGRLARKRTHRPQPRGRRGRGRGRERRAKRRDADGDARLIELFAPGTGLGVKLAAGRADAIVAQQTGPARVSQR